MDIEKIRSERVKLNIQLSEYELEPIINIVELGCNLLVFGVGNDSKFWLENNKNGKTIFIEDDITWIDKIKQIIPDINVFVVKYNTLLSEATKLLYTNEQIYPPEKLQLELNDEIKNTAWDVILVDGPRGCSPDSPGRMKSIYQSSVLIKNGGHIFVHDCHRDLESVYSNLYLLEKNMIEEIKPYGMRHYIINKN